MRHKTKNSRNNKTSMELIKDQTKLLDYIDPDFVNWKVDEGVGDTGITLNPVKQEKDFRYSDVFNPDTDCISQEDVISWIEKNKEEILKTGYYYIFLLKNSQGDRFVMNVFECIGELSANVYGLGDDIVWLASRGYVVLFPQRTLESSPKTLSSSLNNMEEIIKQVLYNPQVSYPPISYTITSEGVEPYTAKYIDEGDFKKYLKRLEKQLIDRLSTLS